MPTTDNRPRYDEADKRQTLPDFTVHDADRYRTRNVKLRLATWVGSTT